MDKDGNEIATQGCFKPSHKLYDLQTGSITNACDKDEKTDVFIKFKSSDKSGRYAEVEFSFSSPVQIYGYRICTHNDGADMKEDADPKTWDLHAKLSKADDDDDMDQQGDWVHLHTVENGDIANSGRISRGSCSTTAREFDYKSEAYMLKIYTVRSASPMKIDLGEVAFFDSRGTAVTPAAVYSGNDKQIITEYLTKGVRSLIDSSESTIWRTIVSNTACIVFTFPENAKPVKYHFVSGNEYSARDPKSWQWFELEQGEDGKAAFSKQYMKVDNFGGASADLERSKQYTVRPDILVCGVTQSLNPVP